MVNEPCTKFCGVLISFNEVIKLQSFEFDASDVIPANAQIISFHIFINFMENELSTKLNSVFDHFSRTYKVTKFWMIKLCLDVSDVLTQINILNMLILTYM